MKGTAALGYRSATPDDILQQLQNDYLMRASLDPEVDPGQVLTRDTSIVDWRAMCDLVSLRKIVPSFNEWFGVSIADEAYVAALTPESRKTLGDLCDLVAPAATTVVARPIHLAGIPDYPAGVFFVIRALLEARGVSPASIRPRTPFTSIDPRHVPAVVSVVTRVSGAAQTTIKYKSGALFDASSMLAFGGVATTLMALVGGVLLLVPAGLTCCLGGVAGIAIGRHHEPRSFSFGEARTFGDLARIIARANQTRHI